MTWLRAHKLLIVIYGGLLLLAAFELGDPKVQSGQVDDPAVYLQPGSNVADVSAEVHPGRGLTLYYQAQQAALCSQARSRHLPVCRARGPVRPGEVRELLEQSVATGNRSIELAMYNLAWVLLAEQAPQEQVDAAVASWRESHPQSTRPDPREAFAAQQAGTGEAPAGSTRR